MSKKILSFDLGTGGNKASLYDTDGNCLASAFVSYPTQYPHIGWHEQKPVDWWNAVVQSTRQLLEHSSVSPDEIECIGISGHSLGTVPVAEDGTLLREETPIWSDIRAEKEAEVFFNTVDTDDWYLATGNGFPAACYTVFKVMWYRENEPEMFRRVHKILGTKDYINFKLTGQMKTDFSYASGTGIYNLERWGYDHRFMKASGLPTEIWPDIVPSTRILDELTRDAARELGLTQRTRVVCGGVDNSCMALGARNTCKGRVYTSLGSSAWIAVSSEHPVLDKQYKPYVFAHVIPDLFTSAVSIFSAGTAYTWVKENICSDLVEKAEDQHMDPYILMNTEAGKAPVGSNGLLFNPSLAGGTSQDPNVHIRGGYIGLDLKHGKPDLIRSVMEGIALNLRLRIDLLRKYTQIEDEILFVGGGAKSRFYLGIFADAFNARIVKSNIDQDAGALGAMAIAAVGCGEWSDFEKVDSVHKIEEIVEPDKASNAKYEKLLPIFTLATDYLARISKSLHDLDL